MFLRDTALYWNFVKEDLGMKKIHCFPRKNNFLSLFGNIPAKLLSYYFPSAKNFLLKSTFIKRYGLLTVSLTRTRATLVNILISSVDH